MSGTENGGRSTPLAEGTKLHVPTGGLVIIEEIITFLVNEWGVIPANKQWRDILADTQYRYDKFQVQDKRRAPPPISDKKKRTR
jgi:hypothetical protein